MNIDNVIKNGKKFWSDNEYKLKPILRFAEKTIGEIASLTQLEKAPGPASYINTALKCREHFESNFTRDVKKYFINDKWEKIYSSEVWPVIVQILEQGYASKIKPVKIGAISSTLTYICELEDGLKVGWQGEEHSIHIMCVCYGSKKKLIKFLQENIWKVLNTDCVSIDSLEVNWYTHFLEINKASDHFKFVKSRAGEKYVEYIKKYSEQKLGRSILFYGMPGTGKTSLIKNISNSLNLKTVRLQNLNNIKNISIVDILNIFDPDCIIMEDIDHLYGSDMSTLLEKLESFNFRNKYVFATANDVTKINNALLRPGRFDELVEISSLDDDSLHEFTTDEEILAIIKEFPVAFIVETMKRINSIGKEETLKNMDDIKKRVEKCKVGCKL